MTTLHRDPFELDLAAMRRRYAFRAVGSLWAAAKADIALLCDALERAQAREAFWRAKAEHLQQALDEVRA